MYLLRSPNSTRGPLEISNALKIDLISCPNERTGGRTDAVLQVRFNVFIDRQVKIEAKSNSITTSPGRPRADEGEGALA